MVHNHKATNDILLSNRPENVMLGRTKKVYKVNITIYILWDMHTNRQHKYFFMEDGRRTSRCNKIVYFTIQFSYAIFIRT